MKTEIEWIPVSEKLPRPEDDVLVTVRNKETGTSAVWSGTRYKNGWAISACCDYIELYDVDSDLEVIACRNRASVNRALERRKHG